MQCFLKAIPHKKHLTKNLTTHLSHNLCAVLPKTQKVEVYNMHLQEKTTGSEKTYQGKVFYVTRDTAELEDGKEVQRDVVHHSGGVCVVP